MSQIVFNFRVEIYFNEYDHVVSGVKKSPSPTLVISTFGLAEIISCMPDGLVKIYIGY